MEITGKGCEKSFRGGGKMRVVKERARRRIPKLVTSRRNGKQTKWNQWKPTLKFGNTG